MYQHQGDYLRRSELNRDELEALLAKIYAEIDKDPEPTLLVQAEHVKATIHQKFQRRMFL